jgi:hypothetical protein
VLTGTESLSRYGRAYAGRAVINCGSSAGALIMTLFHQFSVFAASRGEGLHPKLRALLERAAVSPFSEVSMRRDGMIQAGPYPDSEVISSRVNVTPFSRELARPAVAAPKPEVQKLSTGNPKRGGIV